MSSGNKLQSIEVMLKELDVLDERGDRSQRNCRCDSFERDDLEDKIEQEEKEEQFSRDFKKKECKLQFVESMSELDELEGDQDRILKVFDPIK